MLWSCGSDLPRDSADSSPPTDTVCRVGLEGVLLGPDRASPVPEAGGRVWALSAAGDRIETVSLSDGSWTLPLWEDGWTVSAQNKAGDCVSEDSVEVTLSACTWESVELYTDLCIG